MHLWLHMRCSLPVRDMDWNISCMCRSYYNDLTFCNTEFHITARKRVYWRVCRHSTYLYTYKTPGADVHQDTPGLYCRGLPLGNSSLTDSGKVWTWSVYLIVWCIFEAPPTPRRPKKDNKTLFLHKSMLQCPPTLWDLTWFFLFILRPNSVRKVPLEM